MVLRRETISSKIKTRRSLGVLILHLMINPQQGTEAALGEEAEIVGVEEDQTEGVAVALEVEIEAVEVVVVIAAKLNTTPTQLKMETSKL
jgi:hypothetical protein